MRVRIHRGARQVGGTCVELESQGRRLLLDLGRPLEAERDEFVPLPRVAGLLEADPTLLGIVLSHPHQDHWGQIPDVHTSVPVYTGGVAGRILREAAFFGAGAYAVATAAELRHAEPLHIGPFQVTPFAADHSAADAYSLLVEADHQRLFYTGDLRAHGRHHGRFDDLIAAPPADIDALLMEGTHVQASGAPTPRGPTEADVQAQFENTLAETKGLVLAAFSAQNIDRLCGVYAACLATGRTLVVDLYAATMAAAVGDPGAPLPGSPNYRVWVPQNQRVRIKEAGAFERVNTLGAARIFPEEMARLGAKAVVLYRDGVAAQLARMLAPDGATLVWSMWRGYLDGDRGARTRQRIRQHHWHVAHHHASGHASVADLQALVHALTPRTVVPIHSFAPERYASLFNNVVVHADGTWWEVGS